MQLLQSRALPLGYPAIRSFILVACLARLKTKMRSHRKPALPQEQYAGVHAWFQVGNPVTIRHEVL
jgi:hypothetical protein